jgi:glycosyltransferase involved in cell wall biosynthesis
VFALSSIDAGLPNVVLEAMSAGTPVVAADAGGTSEIITDGENGFVVPVRDAPALAERIGRLVDDGDLSSRIGSEGTRTVQERFSVPRMVDNIENIFINAIN